MSAMLAMVAFGNSPRGYEVLDRAIGVRLFIVVREVRQEWSNRS